MKLSKERLRDLLLDIPFFDNENCFCLGDTMAEAGNIVRKIVSYRESEVKSDEERPDNVGMDI